MSAPKKIVLFCGGRGSATIIRALLRDTQVGLTLIVNAYDDGLSTGALRNFIPGMLGPSDFRKNFSYLLGNYSSAQYALKSLMEYRLPDSTGPAEIGKIADFARTGDLRFLAPPLKEWLSQIPPSLSQRLRSLLGRFFDHAAGISIAFDYRDSSFGNLVFAGAYLAHDNDFNAAAAEVSDLVGSRATLLNVSGNENRVLVGLKADGTFLSNEARIVGAQSAVPIVGLYLLKQPLTTEETRALEALPAADRRAFLAARDSVPALSSAAATALLEADVILYGPGTQHSSLLPSYRIAAAALGANTGCVKALVLNLDGDHDIQCLSASDIVDRAMAYGASVSHILLDRQQRVPPGGLAGETWRSAIVVRGDFANPFRPQLHNGQAVADCALTLHADPLARLPLIDVFADIHNRSMAGDELIEEFLETVWQGGAARLILNRVSLDADLPQVQAARQEGLFPEAGFLRDWLQNGESDYLVLMTGDGAYRFRDVQNIIRLLEQQRSLGGVFGSRTQSRKQFVSSVRAAYGEHRMLYWLGKVAAFFLSILFYLRTGVILSDPLTGLRVFRRASLAGLPLHVVDGNDTPLAVVRRLIRNGVEIAELPVLYRTFSGFTDPYWRIRRGARNLASLVFP